MYPLAVALVLSSLLYLAYVVLRSRRPVPVADLGDPTLQYVIVVPCLDEEIVIGDTLRSLCELPVDRVRIIVVDDDSADRTAQIVSTFAPRVELIQRRRPRAQIGKGDSLNVAFAHILATSDHPLDKLVIGVVDADGRLAPHTVDVADRYFAEPDVGGLQLAVSIRNRRDNLLARMQDFEFLGFAPTLLTAREHLGSVALGGNGQFARVSALAKLGPAPWTDSLTEDLDLGIRLLLSGSRVRFTTEARIEQQGLTSLTRLLRQRTRWVQGHLQCWNLLPAAYRSGLPNRSFLDICYALIAPGLMLLASFLFAAAPALLIWTVASGHARGGIPALAVFLVMVYVLMFGPAILYGLAYHRHLPEVSLPRAIGFAHLMPLYTYMWYAAAWRALARIVLRRTSWAKTERLHEPTSVAAEPVLQADGTSGRHRRIKPAA